MAEIITTASDPHKVAHYKYNNNEAKAITVDESICTVYVKSVPAQTTEETQE